MGFQRRLSDMRGNLFKVVCLFVITVVGQGIPVALTVSPISQEFDSSRSNSAGLGPESCGYDAFGAEEALRLHTANVQARLQKVANAGGSVDQLNSTEGSVRATNLGDVALIEDDGSIIIPPNKFDLKKRSLLFTPENGGYRLTREQIPFEKDEGFALGYFFGVDGTPGGEDNGYREMVLERPFPFFGVLYDRIFVGTNGYLTFTEGDTSGKPSTVALSSQLPRISPLWSDLDTSEGGNIFFNKLPDRIVVTWKSMPQAVFPGLSTFQVVLYEDGRIAFVYKKAKARQALVGISPGRTDQEAVPVDFSNPPQGPVSGVYEAFSNQQRLDIPALTRAFYRSNSDAFEFLYIWTDFEFDNGIGLAHAFNIRNDIKGIGLPLFDRGLVYGSEDRLSTIVIMGDYRDWPADPDQHRAGLFSGIAITCHELGHRWLAYVRFDANQDIKDDLLGREASHWSFFADSRTNDEGTTSSVMEGNAWSDNGNGVFTSTQLSANHFSELDQYLMGLRSPDEVGNLPYLFVADRSKAYLRTSTPASNFSIGAVRRHTTVEQIIEREGQRIPSSIDSPKLFKAAFVLLTEQNSTPSDSTIEQVDRYRRSLVRYFSAATRRRGSLDAELSID